MAKRFLKYFGISIAVMTTITVIVALFGLATQGQPEITHIFIISYFVGGIIILIGISSVAEAGSLAYKPQNRQPNFKDYQTHKALTARKAGSDSKNGAKFMFIGICIVAIAALAQLIVNIVS